MVGYARCAAPQLGLQQLPDLEQSEVEEIESVGRKIHFRAYPEVSAGEYTVVAAALTFVRSGIAAHEICRP